MASAYPSLVLQVCHLRPCCFLGVPDSAALRSEGVCLEWETLDVLFKPIESDFVSSSSTVIDVNLLRRDLLVHPISMSSSHTPSEGHNKDPRHRPIGFAGDSQRTTLPFHLLEVQHLVDIRDPLVQPVDHNGVRVRDRQIVVEERLELEVVGSGGVCEMKVCGELVRGESDDV